MSLQDVTDPLILKVIDEMNAFRKEFMFEATNKNNDLLGFWLRKTKKPVLAVLLVQKDGQEAKLYRG